MRSKLLGVCAAFLLAAVAALGGASAAMADDVPVAISFDEPRTQSLEYGQPWNFAFHGDTIVKIEYDFSKFPGNASAFEVRSTGVPAGYIPQVYVDVDYAAGAAGGSVYSNYDQPPLDAGTYTFVVSVDGFAVDAVYKGETTPAATLTISPTAVETEVRVVPDESSPDHAIVTARFTGRFVDEYQSSSYPGAAISPGGQWTITVKDSAGKIAVERTIDRVAGDDTLATSFYWSDSKPGEQYTATATFAASGASASNFSIAPAPAYPFTATDGSREIAASDAGEKPAADLPPEPDFSVPVWWVILIAVALVTLLAFAVILGLRLGRAPVKISPAAISTGDHS